MKTAGKILLGTAIGAGMIGLAIALGKPKREATIVPPKNYGGKDGAGAPSRPDWNSAGGIPGTEGGDGTGGGWTRGPQGAVYQSGPVGSGFTLSKPSGAGPVGLRITNALDMVQWVLAQAQGLGAGNLDGADGVIKKVAKIITDRKIGSIRFDQLPDLGQIKWNDALALVKNVPWSTVGPLAKSFLKGKGIG